LQDIRDAVDGLFLNSCRFCLFTWHLESDRERFNETNIIQ